MGCEIMKPLVPLRQDWKNTGKNWFANGLNHNKMNKKLKGEKYAVYRS
jgi:hypothetical protein